ncbi:MAG TPA: spore coat protein CotJB [Firmicutes bacterium]|nr:spore coat protein CotJB [Candidatus Fermentithermobacillaceae bacterium]
MDARYFDMLRRIMELQFVTLELNLFLDTHPCDERALHDFKEAQKALTQAIGEFERSFHPLFSFGIGHVEDGWNWISDPWPWEINWHKRRG